MRRLAPILCLALTLVSRTALAQAVVDPGMTKAQVVAKLGTPLAERTSGTQTFLYFKNGAERRSGMNDVVILDGDKVVDAVFRAKDHVYSGKSSSPHEIPAATARNLGHDQPKARMAPAAKPPKDTAKPAGQPAQSAVKAAAKPNPELPAEKAQAGDVVRPMPAAGSGQRAEQKAKDDAAAERKSADEAQKKAADPKAPAPKKP